MNRGVFLPSAILRVPSSSFPLLLIHSTFLFSSFPYFALKFLFTFHPVVGMSLFILPLLASRIFSVILKRLVLSVLFYPVSIYFFSLLFPSTFRFISWNCIVCFTCVAFTLSPQNMLAFSLYLIIFACCKFLTCVSSWITSPGFELLFVFFLSQTYFTPA